MVGVCFGSWLPHICGLVYLIWFIWSNDTSIDTNKSFDLTYRVVSAWHLCRLCIKLHSCTSYADIWEPAARTWVASDIQNWWGWVQFPYVCVCVFASGSTPAVLPIISALRMLSRQSSSDFSPLICAMDCNRYCILRPAGLERAIKQIVLVNDNRSNSVSAFL